MKTGTTANILSLERLIAFTVQNAIVSLNMMKSNADLIA